MELQKANILVFPCGTEIAMEIFHSLKYARFLTLFGASSVDDHGMYVYKNYFSGVPFFNEPGFIEALNKIIDENEIDFIFPSHDSPLLEMSRCSDKLHAKVLTSPYETCEICRSKLKTYEFFQNCEYVPRVYADASAVTEFPVFIKPDIGQGSSGIQKIDDREQLLRALSGEKKAIVEYLPGEEYTVDCFTDRYGVLQFASMRTRARTRNGISVHSAIVHTDPTCRAIAESINSMLKFEGLWFFQVKHNRGGAYRLLEIAPRVAGTMCVHRAAGVNLPLLTVYDRMGFDVSCVMEMDSVEADRALINRYRLKIDYDRVVVDFDDTLVINGAVNTQLVSFLYQCVNTGKKIVLLTKHAGALAENMNRARISPTLFDEIIQIEPSSDKADFFAFKPVDIFIDDSFSERKKVRQRYGIKTFSVDMVEGLLDWRM